MTTTFDGYASPSGGGPGYYWGMAQVGKWSARMDAVLSRIATERGTTVDELMRPITPEERAEEDERFRVREQLAARVQNLVSRIPDIYRDAVVRTAAGEEWLQAYERGVKHKGLVILGPPGAGKTWEAYAITRRLLLDHGVPVSTISAPDLVSMFRPNDDGMADIGIFQSAPVIVIDDLGSERLTEWGAEQFWRLADSRRNRLMPFIITSNLTRTQIRARYDTRLVDRLIADATVIDVQAHPEADRHLPF